MTTPTTWATGLIALAVLLSGCTPAPAPAPVDGPAKSVPSPQREDAALAEQMRAVGFDSGTAAFAQLTTSTLAVNDGHTFIIRHAFANGATGTTAIHLFASGDGVVGTPSSPVATVTATSLRYSFRYAIKASDLPADLRAQVLAGLPASAPDQAQRDGAVAALVAPAGGPALPADGGESSTIQVLVDALISQTTEFGIDEAIETAELDKTHAGTSWEAFKAGKKVWDAIDSNALIADALTRINAARDCAARPTDPLTIRHYEENPGAQEEVLRELDDIHDEVTVKAVATFAALFADTAGGLAKSAPWLGFITGPAVSYIKENLASVIEDRVHAAEQLVPKCTLSYSIDGGGHFVNGKGKVCDLAKPFTLSGSGVTVKFVPSSAKEGTFTYSGNPEGFTVFGNGTYVVTADKSGGRIVASGPDTVVTPAGKKTYYKEERYGLTPLTEPCS